MRPSGVLVVDDDFDLCRLVRQLLEPAGYVVWEAPTAEAGLEIAARERPAVVLLDVHLPGTSGYEALRRLRDTFGNGISIVFVSGERTEDFDRTAGLMLGADDYVVKPFVAGELVARVRRAAERAASIAPQVVPQLTPREREVLVLLAQGLGQPKIAETLYITSKTVATHIQRILLKLDVHSRAEAVAFAHRHGLVGPS